MASADEPAGEVRPPTDFVDLPASVIGLIDTHRWQVAVLFCWLKRDQTTS